MTRVIPSGVIERWRSLDWRNDPDGEAVDPGGPIVAIEDLSITWGDVRALDAVTATIEPGRLIGLVGPNGAGKTTLLRGIAGAIQPDDGRVEVTGRDITRLSSRAASRRVAVVPQETTLRFDFSVRELVAMGRTPYQSRVGGTDRADRRAVDRAMDLTDVSHFADRQISEVSGGERQRILISRALAQDTPLLLLDEPIASLDINHQIRTLELVRDLVADGTTVIAAIHDLNLAARYCDELLLLDDGQLVEKAQPADVLTPANVEDTFGTDTAIVPHPVTGRVHVTPLHASNGRNTRVHVLGSGWKASRVVFDLVEHGYRVSLGPVSANDPAMETAQALDVDTIPGDLTQSIDQQTRERLCRCLAQADAAVRVGAAELPAARFLPENIPVYVLSADQQQTSEDTSVDSVDELLTQLQAHDATQADP